MHNNSKSTIVYFEHDNNSHIVIFDDTCLRRAINLPNLYSVLHKVIQDVDVHYKVEVYINSRVHAFFEI